ncbi:MAG: hypothetical protein A3F17_00355 [Gammaproteobacteria bacterium RIFCSPHIGHO2_12_FULL_41_15]|nr:MAG: hypothetical protein A3F17_00355 [Gammaproteobacteria bacterium RIFCSPHIGHO2_12_FULL_41_15]
MKIEYTDPGKLLTVLLALPFAFFGITIYAGTLPAIQIAYHTSTTAILLTISSYLLGLGLGLLILNVQLLNKRWLAISLILFPITTLLITYLSSMTIFFLLRFILGLLAAIIFLATENAKLTLEESYHQFYINIYSADMMMLAPILAPLIGSSLYVTDDWHIPLLLFTGYAFLLFILTTLYFTAALQTPFADKKLLVIQKKLFLSGFFQITAIKYSLLFMNILALTSIGSFLLQSRYGLSPQQYGFTISGMGVAILIGQIVSHSLTHQRIQTLEKPAVTLSLLNSLFLLLFYYTGTHPLYLIVLTGILNLFIVGLLLPYYKTCSMIFKPGLSQLSNRTFTGTWILYAAILVFASSFYDPFTLLTLTAIWLGCHFAVFALVFLL